MNPNPRTPAVVLAATALGLRLPQDLTLIGFAGSVIHVGGDVVPTLLLPEREMGRQAVAMVLSKIAQSDCVLPATALPLTLAADSADALGTAP